jgi:hypothetical protein
MQWCFNRLRVQGSPTEVDEFARIVRVAKELAHRSPLIYPLYFGTLAPRPLALDVNEEPMGDLAYDAYHGDFSKVLEYPGILGRGFTTRMEVCRFLGSRSSQFRSFEKLFESNLQHYGHRTWLTWNLEHYGTKWDLNEDTRFARIAPGVIEYHFQTMGAPPEPWVKLAARQFPALDLSLLDALADLLLSR